MGGSLGDKPDSLGIGRGGKVLPPHRPLCILFLGSVVVKARIVVAAVAAETILLSCGSHQSYLIWMVVGNIPSTYIWHCLFSVTLEIW